MSRPFRRFCFYLASELGKSLNEIMRLNSDEISEWAAYYQTIDVKWSDKYAAEAEKEKQRNDPEYKAGLLKELLGGKK